MRVNQPLPTLTALEGFLAEPDIVRALSVHRVLPAQAAGSRSPARLARSTSRRGAALAWHRALYRHQREALDALRLART